MLLNKRLHIELDGYRKDEESGKKDDTTPKSDKTTPKTDQTTPKSVHTKHWVYICTTMYREVFFVYSMLDREVKYLIFAEYYCQLSIVLDVIKIVLNITLHMGAFCFLSNSVNL